MVTDRKIYKWFLQTKYMSKRNLLSIIGAALVAGCSSIPLNGTVNSRLKSNYTAMGFLVHDNPVVQTDVTVKSNALTELSGNIWTNYDTKTGTMSEVDFSATYSKPISDNLLLNVGGVHYEFDWGKLPFNDAQDIGIWLTTQNLPLDFTFKADQIFGNGSGHGRNYALSVSKSLDLGKGVSISAGADVNYNEHYFNSNTGLAYTSGTIGLNADLGKGFSLNAGYYKQFPLDKDSFGDTFAEGDTFILGFSKIF